jgi:hypothetical protein
VVLESSNGSLSSIASVHSRWYKLEVHIFVVEELFEKSGALIVEVLQLGAHAGLAELGVEGLVGGEDRLGGS